MEGSEKHIKPGLLFFLTYNFLFPMLSVKNQKISLIKGGDDEVTDLPNHYLFCPSIGVLS